MALTLNFYVMFWLIEWARGGFFWWDATNIPLVCQHHILIL
jgi:hypothetical protein